MRRLEPIHQLFADTAGSQIIEFAVSLPLLVVLVVGIFDFGSAFNLKQKIHNAALLAARVGANQPTRDLSTTGACNAPESICAIRDAVANNLTAGKVNDCGLATATATAAPPLGWTFTTNTGCLGTLTLTIKRGETYATTLSPPFETNYTIEATKVELKYPYRWQFSNVFRLVSPSATISLPSQIQSDAVVQNVN
jgi:Flp pilus assembly protein TadG